MKIIGINGSPNPSGLTSLLLNKAIEGARSAGAETETIILNELKFDPCQECHGCDKTGECVLEDDLKPVYKKILFADGLIVVSPIYFGTVSAQLKMLIDRLQCVWVAKNVLKRKAGPEARKGVFVCVGGEDRIEYFDAAKKAVRMAFNTMGVEYAGELFIGGMNNLPADSPQRKTAAKEAFRLGASLLRNRT